MAEINLNKNNFQSLAAESKLPVLIDFWAAWCNPCKMLSPVISELAEELDGRVLVGKVNVDDEPELAREFGVESIPTVIVMNGGKVTARSVGFVPKDELTELIGL